MTLSEAKALIGTTWEDTKGLRREITRIDRIRECVRFGTMYVTGYAYWKRPGKIEQSRGIWFPNFEAWLQKAKRVGP